ncbi:hypothetical protein BHM03_00047492, partial [Ensete ventricosum]
SGVTCKLWALGRYVLRSGLRSEAMVGRRRDTWFLGSTAAAAAVLFGLLPPLVALRPLRERDSAAGAGSWGHEVCFLLPNLMIFEFLIAMMGSIIEEGEKGIKITLRGIDLLDHFEGIDLLSGGDSKALQEEDYFLSNPYHLGAAKVSIIMIGQQAIMDAYLCLLHLTAGILVGKF